MVLDKKEYQTLVAAWYIFVQIFIESHYKCINLKMFLQKFFEYSRRNSSRRLSIMRKVTVYRLFCKFFSAQ